MLDASVAPCAYDHDAVLYAPLDALPFPDVDTTMPDVLHASADERVAVPYCLDGEDAPVDELAIGASDALIESFFPPAVDLGISPFCNLCPVSLDTYLSDLNDRRRIDTPVSSKELYSDFLQRIYGCYYTAFTRMHECKREKGDDKPRGHLTAANGWGGATMLWNSTKPSRQEVLIDDFCTSMFMPLQMNVASLDEVVAVPWSNTDEMISEGMSLVVAMDHLVDDIRGASKKHPLPVKVMGAMLGATDSLSVDVSCTLLMQVSVRIRGRMPVVLTVFKDPSSDDGLSYFVNENGYLSGKEAARTAHRLFFLTPLSKEESNVRRADARRRALLHSDA